MGTNNYDNIHLILPSKMISAVNNNSTQKMISSVLEMISTDGSNSHYAMTENNITLEEELYMKKFFDIDVYKYTSAMMFGNMRFIFFGNEDHFICNDKDRSFSLMLYTIKSSVNEDSINNFSTYFISKSALDNEDETYKLVINIIKNKLARYMEQEFGFTFSEFGFAFYDTLLPRTKGIPYAKTAFCYYDTLFSTLDNVIGLKYNDFEKIFDILYPYANKSKDKCHNLLEIIYKNSITLPRTVEADNKAFKEFFYYI